MGASSLRTREWRALLDAVERLYLPVHRHAGHLFAKLGVETRTAAAAAFLR